MNYWILPSNEDKFRLSDLLKVRKLVDWKQHNNYEVGDVVFMYNSRPWHRILYMMSVERVNVPSSEYLNGRQFWKDPKECDKGLKENRFVRFRLFASAPSSANLTFDDLQKKGLKSSLQGAVKVTDSDLLYYIKKEILPDTKEKIARICWNSQGWVKPSGPEGKAKSQSYESENGYGHEEWLLDRSKIMSDGYHYAFLEPLRKSSFEGTRDIHLYTITPERKRKYIGCIYDAEYVSSSQADQIWSDYVTCGWADSMKDDLNEYGLHLSHSFGNEKFAQFNVRFKFDKFVDYSDQQLFFRMDDPSMSNSHYKLLNKRSTFLFETSTQSVIDSSSEGILDPNNQIPEGAKSRITVNRYERSQEAREQCLKAKGYSCSVCGMNFEKMYGNIGKEFIHVHHVVPISEIGQSYIVDPIHDLEPVCPNCHAMLHHGANGKVLSIAELKKLIQK